MNSQLTKTMLLSTLSLLALPISGHARESAIDQCIQKVVTEVVPEGFPVVVQKTDGIEQAPSLSDAAGTMRVLVIARGQDTGKTYGRGTCVVNRTGKLVAVTVSESRIEADKQAG
jgi:hypothetical protein